MSGSTGTGGLAVLNPALTSLAVTQPQAQAPAIPTRGAGTMAFIAEGVQNGPSFRNRSDCRTAGCFLWDPRARGFPA